MSTSKMVISAIRKYSESRNPPLVSAGIFGATIGILNNVCGSVDNRKKILKLFFPALWRGNDVSSKALDKGQKYALTRWVRPVRSEEKWYSGRLQALQTEVIDLLSSSPIPIDKMERIEPITIGQYALLPDDAKPRVAFDGVEVSDVIREDNGYYLEYLDGTRVGVFDKHQELWVYTEKEGEIF